MKIDNHRLFIALERYIETIKKRNINTVNYDDFFSIYYIGDAPFCNIIYRSNKIIISSKGCTFDFSEIIFERLIASIANIRFTSSLNRFFLYKKDFIFFIKCKLI